ncbi:MAG TPA: nucleoside monophosphate kinase [Candidatus Saccharimonadales bacterium]|nr:nucleoside monophosphate kinase [Candidatus Saccharimonadales bacterium]
MVIFFGPAGAGKSVQGQILAARFGWRWLSAGQLLRDSHDVEVHQQMSTGGLVKFDKVNEIVREALIKAKDIPHVILDGYPRELGQAKWLIETQPEHQRSIGLVVVLEVPREELLHRLEIRGRSDDTAEIINQRLQIYRKEIYPILAYFNELHIPIVHINGTGTVGQVHDRIESELKLCSLV